MSGQNVAYRSPRSSSSVPNSPKRTFSVWSCSTRMSSLPFYQNVFVTWLNLDSSSGRIVIASVDRGSCCRWIGGIGCSSCFVAGCCMEFVHDNPKIAAGTYSHLLPLSLEIKLKKDVFPIINTWFLLYISVLP